MAQRILDDRYEFLSVLAEGRQGRLHYAWDRHDRRAAAIREISVSLPEPGKAGGRFSSELHDIAAFEHANLMPVWALRRVTGGSVFVIGPYVDGLNLATLLTRLESVGKVLPESLVLHIAGEILDGLVFALDSCTPSAASGGIIHGHLTPERVLLGAQGSLILTGLAESRLICRRRAVTSDTTSVGEMIFAMLTGVRRSDGPEGSPASEHDGLLPVDEDLLRRSGCSPVMRRIVITAIGRGYPSAREMRDDLPRTGGRSDGGSLRLELAQLVQNLLTAGEIEERRRLAMLRGTKTPASEMERLQSEDLLPLATESPFSGITTPIPADPVTTRPPGMRPVVSRTEQLNQMLSPVPAVAAMRRSVWQRKLKRPIGVLVPVLVLAVTVFLAWRFRSEPEQDQAVAEPEIAVLDTLANVLRTIPAGAQVWINEVHVGETPYAYAAFEPGPLRLRFEYPGLTAVDTVVIVRRDHRFPIFPPFVFRTHVSFASVPAGGRPIVNGRLLRDFEASTFTIATDETLMVAMELLGVRSPSVTRVSPISGLLPPTDTAQWRWRPASGESPALLTAIFARLIRLHSHPPGALIFLDGDSLPCCRTNGSVALAYGAHDVLLQKPPFLDYRFSLTVADQTPDLYAPIMQRTVRLAAVDARDRHSSLSAAIEWIRLEDRYVRAPDDRLHTPYSLQLDGVPHEIRFSHEGFADTTVALPGDAVSLKVAMRPLARGERDRTGDDDAARRSWVRFVVKAGRRRPIAGAEVIGVDKTTGDIVRYGLTDADGVLLTRVPVGDYEWRAAKDGYEGRTNSERIPPRRRIKEIGLRLAPR